MHGIAGVVLWLRSKTNATPETRGCLPGESLPDLHVIAADSLLDFALREFEHSMPVGRVEYLHLNPVTFQEFLRALGEDALAEYIRSFHVGDEMSRPVLERLRELLRVYFFVGGMPAAVAAYAGERDLLRVQRIHTSIIMTLQDDFARYGSRSQQRNMHRVLQFVPRNLGRKVKYVNIARDVRSYELRTAVELLDLSRLVSFVRHSSANGVPLGAEASNRHFKALLLDVGLCNNLCGLSLIDTEHLTTVQEGGLAEQFIGQELRCLGPSFEDRALYYWHREAKSSSAEVDYLWTCGATVLPVEVRAGTSGSLKSIHVFLAEKDRGFAVRFNMGPPSLGRFRQTVRAGGRERGIEYALLSLPLFLVDQMDRLLEETLR
ncbi:MAG: DUF4143 domain-containing protein [Candidatus Eisenbacteria bacterium]|nr:DUF4143 domain-containing protein [Candidatus Eisenbacteria bacterium]